MLDSAAQIRKAGDGGAAVHRANRDGVVGIDLLRFAAAALVMLFHMACTSWIDPNSDAFRILGGGARYPEWLGLARNGWVGVEIFFVISGFVIAFSARDASPSRFLRSRVLRLIPGIWICGTVTFALSLILGLDAPSVLVQRFLNTLIVGPIPRWVDGVYWTLSIEIAFYTLVGLLMATGRRAALEPVMIAVGFASTALWIVAASGVVPGLEVLAGKRIAQLLLMTHGCFFALGVLAFQMFDAGLTRMRIGSFVVCLAGGLVQIASAEQMTVQELRLGAPDGAPLTLFLGFMLLFAFAVACNRAMTRHLPPTALRFTRMMGLATYPLYLLHTFVGILTMRLAIDAGLSPDVALTSGIVVSVAVALAVAAQAEPRLRRFLAGAMDRLSGTGAAAKMAA